MSKPDAESESLAIPDSVRRAVDERDRMACRVCGKFLGDRRALHHVIYGGDERGMGGRRVHNVDEIVTVCWLPGDGDCHNLVHSAKRIWQPILLEVARRGGVTAFQVKRWQAQRSKRKTPTNKVIPVADQDLELQMICDACRAQNHQLCVDVDQDRPIRACACQHRADLKAEPATGPVGE